MTSAKLLKYNSAKLSGEASVINPALTTDETAAIAGLCKDANLDNYISDLEDLAYRIYRYLDLRERSNAEDESELLAQLQYVTNHVKDLAAIYTDCFNEAFDHFRKTQRQIKLQLNQYPDEIADLQRQILRADRQIRQLSESATILITAIDRQIAFDTSLKNDAQRKAKRIELMESDSDYITASIALRAAQDRRESLLIELQLLRNQFSILKLDRQEAIATKQLAAVDVA
jgi:hypothetical protein